MPVGDIRPLKNELREKSKAFRREMSPELKRHHDEAIRARVTGLWQYRSCKTLLTYVSTSIEVDTRALILTALEEGKRVAVPRCVPGTRDMEFYYIRGLEELEPGTFGVLEPVPGRSVRMTDFSSGLCLVPALCYDWKGYRLGYGSGYYDRFLSGCGAFFVGVAYEKQIVDQVPYSPHDRKMHAVVTERACYDCLRGY